VDAVTPGRQTEIVLNDFLGRVIQPYWSQYREPRDWGTACTFADTECIRNIGVRLAADYTRPHEFFESNSAGQLKDSRVTVSSDSVLTYFLRQNADATYSGGDAATFPMYQKAVSSTGAWSTELSSDAASFVGPVIAGYAAMNRILVSVDDHKPTTTLSFFVSMPGSQFTTFGPIANFYFSGIRGGVGETNEGTGHYCLSCGGDGMAQLYERLDDDSWVRRGVPFTYAASMTAGQVALITIMSDAVDDGDGNYTGKVIKFVARAAGHIGGGLLESAIDYVANKGYEWVYRVAHPGTTTTLTKVRIDARGDARVCAFASEAQYPETGTFTDGAVRIPFPATGSTKLYLYWYGPRPTGTTVEASITWLDFATPVTDSGTITTDDARGQIIEFTLPSPAVDADGNVVPPMTFQVSFALGTTDPAVTPTILNYTVARAAVVETASITPTSSKDDAARALSLPTFFPYGPVSINCATEDPAVESASVSIADPTGTNIAARWRTGTPITVNVLDPSDGSTLTKLFRGIIGQSQPEIIGKDGLVYPNDDGYLVSFQAQGEWARVQRRMAPCRLSLYEDTDTGKLPMKATDAIRELLEQCGYTSGQIDIPDLPVRMFGTSGDQDGALTIEPSTLFGDMIKQTAEDYLGARIIWDCNAGAGGMWRLIQRQAPPYNYLMRFYIEHPGAKKAAHRLESYADVTLGSGQVQKANYIIGGTESYTYEPPEGNLVQVFGSATDGKLSGKGSVARVMSFAFNPQSYNAFNLSTGHTHYPEGPDDNPDFLGECVQIQVFDPTLTDQAAADWICRRIYDVACFGREYMRFRAPLVLVTDDSDANQTYPRPLRFGDPVEIQQRDGSYRTYLCTKCNPSYTQDGFQEAEYEFVTTTNIDVVGLLPSSYDLASLTRTRIRAAKRAMGQTSKDNPTRANSRHFSISAAIIAGYPVFGAQTPIQNMDTTSADFGQFFYLEGYDPAP